ncbi:HCL225Wp [Eremothecium sinecaudum]|uniref:HCL225Wp n=1 Tax=Eremothecium sinecaudum TaxID=45286 RepID=A0A0X8HR58_9SACH|nr:HCL225Wp [Eremothecium sinecaudum]AMD19926.1 HCL225Wp [Eremothecium sinecaudum]
MSRHFSSCASHQFLRKLNKTLLQVSSPQQHVVKQLVKPVGLPVKPSPTVYKQGNSALDIFSSDKRSKRVEELGNEVGKSGMYHLHFYRKTKGKLFISPAGIWSANSALYFPHLKGKRVADNNTINVEDCFQGKLSVVAISSCEEGQKLVDSYLGEYNRDAEALRKDTASRDGPPVQIVNMTLADGWVKAFVARIAAGRMLAQFAPEVRDRVYVCNRNQLPFSLRELLQINNPYTGYVFVVDKNSKIRWMACGAAGEKGFSELWKVVRTLQRENSVLGKGQII